MADIATITFTGRITNDPILKHTQNGTALLSLSIACNRWKNGETVTSFYNCALWGKSAEGKAKFLTKGMHVVASGAIDIVEYEGRGGKTKQASVQLNYLEASPQSRDTGQKTNGYGSPPDGAEYPTDPLDYGPEDFNDDIPF